MKIAESAPELLELLGVMFDAYEEGQSCHEYTDGEPGVFIGNAVRLSDEHFHRIADLLNRLDPRPCNSALHGKNDG